ncbi:P-loop NTPase fold protein [Streptomyces sp. NBC_00005]|uniref:P-loop NTPase fold protein n=1 Tax=Streptomyces sp. NBC_00005 TaxID=2903609 RepID=UPI00324A8927
MEQTHSCAQEFVLMNDEPATSFEDDLLGEGLAAQELAALLLASRGSTPLTLAVDARRGMGKSTLMHLVDAKLKKAGVCTVWYDAWTAGHEDYLEGLMKTTLAQLDSKVLRRTMARLAENRALVGAARTGLVMVAAPLGAGRMADEIWRSLSIDARTRNKMRDDIETLFDQWMAQAPGAPSRFLVVFIDDLDRCSEAAVRAVSEALKIYLGIPGIAFVVGCDRSVHSATRLLQNYSPETAEFMEKIFQTSYRIPGPKDEEIAAYIRGCAVRAGVDRLLDNRLIELLADSTRRNPRNIKRLLNGFVLESRLNPIWSDFPPEVVFRIVLLQYSYADFYRLLVEDEEGGDDAVREFDGYRHVQHVLRRTAGTDPPDESWARVTRFFAEHKVAPPLRPDPDDWAHSLAELEQQVPLRFAELDEDRQFVSLISGLMQLSEGKELLERLRRQPLVISPVALDVPDPREDTADSLTGQGQAYYQGLRVIWVDDHPRHRQRLVGELRARGADVTEEPDTTAAEHRMRDAKAGAGAPFHLLISDFTRGGDPEAGLLTVERWQEDDTHTGRVIFFSHRVTPAREVRGSKLGALVTSTDDQLLRWAFRIARQIREEAPPMERSG